MASRAAREPLGVRSSANRLQRRPTSACWRAPGQVTPFSSTFHLQGRRHRYVSPFSVGRCSPGGIRGFGSIVCRAIDTDTSETPQMDESSVEGGVQDSNKARRGTGLELPVLCLVPIAWGTWGPAGRLVFELPTPPNPLVFNFFIQVVSASILLLVVLLSSFASQKNGPNGANELKEHTSITPSLSWKKRIRAGFELGGLLFLGSTFQLIGLQYSTASRVSFFVQLTTLMVPCAEAILLGRPLARRTWIACGVALLGVLLLSLDTGGQVATAAIEAAASEPSHTVLFGDALAAFSAIFYTGHVLRLDKWASQTKATELAAAKATTQLCLCGVSLLICSFQGSIHPVDWFFGLEAGALGVFVACALWNGAIPSAFTVWAQSFGQSTTPPTKANLIYTMQPMWAALTAFLVLGERLGFAGLCGGGAILAASVIAIRP